MNNPFNLTFGKEPDNIIFSSDYYDEIIKNFTQDNSPCMTYLISGVRGSGKTVMLSKLNRIFSNMDDFIVVELNPELDLLEQLASSLYEKMGNKFKSLKKEFSFSFSGFTFKISGREEVSSVVTLLERIFDYLVKKNKKVLIIIDDVYNNKNMRVFVSQYQIFLRENYLLYLLMSGLFENVRNIQDEKSLTFLYRAPIIYLKALNINNIALSYESILNINEEKAFEMARITKGYAFAYQVLGYIYYDKKQLDIDLLKKFDQYLRDYVYDKLWMELSDTEKEILLNIKSNDDIKVKEVITKTNISNAYFSMYRDRLIKKGILTSTSYGKVSFSLPRFNEFLENVSKYYSISLNSSKLEEEIEHLDFSSIFLAKRNDLDRIKYICDTTINAIYPKYYPKGAVDFFINHHSLDNIKQDILNNRVYVIKDNDLIIGTVTIKDNNINRLFVLPDCHKKGYGKRLIVFSENYILDRYDSIVLDASLPSKGLYLKIGYREIEYHKIETDNGDYLCYDVMRKEKLIK